MALSKLSGDEQGVVFIQLCNVLEPGIAVAFGSANSELWALTQAQRQQLRADNEAAAALCLKMGMRSCKALREAKTVHVRFRLNHLYLCAADLATLGSLGSVLPVLEKLYLFESSAGPDGVQRLMAGLGRGALPALAIFDLEASRLGDAGASALAAALGRGALPRLKILRLSNAAIGDVALVALAPALRRLPALEELYLANNPLGNEGLAALVAPPPPAGAPPSTTGGLTKLKLLDLDFTGVTDTGCATLAAALDGGALPALKTLELLNIAGRAAAKAAVYEALARSRSSELRALLIHDLH